MISAIMQARTSTRAIYYKQSSNNNANNLNGWYDNVKHYSYKMYLINIYIYIFIRGL